MPKARRRRVGNFEVGQVVSVNGKTGRIQTFPTRRVAIVEVGDEVCEISLLDLEKWRDKCRSN